VTPAGQRPPALASPAPTPPGLATFVHAWAAAVIGTSYVPMTRTEQVAFLDVQAHRLVRALTTESFDAAVGYHVGTALTAADFTAPEALGRTTALMHERLLTDLGLADDRSRRRLGRLIETLAEGFARAVRDRTLDAQDEMRRAALEARVRIEHALRTSEARVLHAALHDPLTGLSNRTLFADRLSDALTDPPESARIALCFVGLDRFKLINSTFGHAVGDRVLALVADRMRALADEQGCAVARLGADEFGFLATDSTCADDAMKLADRALRRLAEPMRVGGREIPLSASVGVVERPAAGTEPADVMRAADISLHWAKADGRGRCVLFDADRNADDVARYALSAAMPAGLRRDEFTLLYQPLVELSHGRLVGVEALARWHHPVRGLLGAGEFIGLAEDSGLIVALGLRLLEKACRQAVRWQACTPYPPFISVNLAVRQIRNPGLVGQVAAVLDRVGLAPERLQLEITETAVMSIDDESLATLRALGGLGVRLVIDDFGTGYANLSYLCDLPVHGLKLAAPFIDGIDDLDSERARKRRALLETMVSVGHRLGLTVTAEGVETLPQAERLRTIGCDLAQGYLFGRPMPPTGVVLP
jgi:diguanylate cyclase (GGDEF)-like protein